MKHPGCYIKLTFLLWIFIPWLPAAVNAQENQLPSDSVFNADSLVAYAEKFIGTPYKLGSSGENAFDCSGFVNYVFKHFCVSTPRSSKDFWSYGKEIDTTECSKGDIILFTGTNLKRNRVGHVGIIISQKGDPVKFIHASSSKNHKGVAISALSNKGYMKRFMGIRRIY
jgi:cell wall-associated NlpC family hydrolase